MKVKSEVEVYEIDGEEVALGKNAEPLMVESHWNRNEFVILRYGSTSITVDGRVLRAAISNAENSKP